MAKRRLGPFSILDAKQIKDILGENGFTFEEFTTESSLEGLRTETKNRLPTNHPNFSHLHEFIHIEVPVESLLLLKGTLEKLGKPLIEQQAEYVEGNEKFCPECDFYSAKNEACPKHKGPMVSFEENNRIKNEQRDRLRSRAVLIFFAIALAIILYNVFTD